ncbi:MULTISPECIES: cadherin-like beta sandwich domain-containing protein [Neobacillus]|uniref:Cadherin-like beta sandwich domain-containing protein n=1 Tax=Neobacillus rhizophilus TaxID=2833579 RepID=A0A942U445_9BACI|nr:MULTISPECIES: cadherin-like beta sandwich domain-containing protein [Neobacillus]MBS4212081.1 cadherin-like beta sandwich domain-containing protein [Neobacillus rhizophilus]MBU8915513.1 cadherin-like beta sandwich domain-containing protein [Bacillus sp. FJAT-29953]
MLSTGHKRSINLFLVTAMAGMSLGYFTPVVYAETTETTQQTQTASPLTKLEIDGVKLDKEFSADVKEYSASVVNEVETIKMLVEGNESASAITINGQSVLSGTPAVFSLQSGENILQIIIYDANHAEATYSVHVTRSAKVEPVTPAAVANSSDTAVGNVSQTTSLPGTNSSFQASLIRTNANNASQSSTQSMSETTQTVSKAKLSSLKVSEGTWDSSFSSDDYTYHIAVPSDATAVTIHPTAANQGASIKIEGGTTKTIQLDNDNKTILSVVVTYSDNDRKTYVLVFDK